MTGRSSPRGNDEVARVLCVGRGVSGECEAKGGKENERQRQLDSARWGLGREGTRRRAASGEDGERREAEGMKSPEAARLPPLRLGSAVRKPSVGSETLGGGTVITNHQGAALSWLPRRQQPDLGGCF